MDPCGSAGTRKSGMALFILQGAAVFTMSQTSGSKRILLGARGSFWGCGIGTIIILLCYK